MTTPSLPRWRRIARLFVIGFVAKTVIVGGAWLLAMNALQNASNPL